MTSPTLFWKPSGKSSQLPNFLTLLPHQKEAVRKLLDTPQCALFALPGSGKTSVALSVLKITGESALIIAPLATALTSWPGEMSKWVQFSGIDFAVAHGSVKARTAAFDHRVTIINPEGVKWLFERPELLNKKTALIVDESTFFKSWSSKRTKMLRKIVPRFSRRHILTGTPVPKTLLAWFSQQYIVDAGESFGTGVDKFRKKYFYPGGYKNYDWLPFDTTSEKLADLARGRFHVAENLSYKTHGLHFIDVVVPLPDKARKIYKTMASKLVIETDAGKVVADNLRQRYHKLRQIASGAVYKKISVAERETAQIHTAKIERVRQIVDEYGGPVVIGYIYDFELGMLRAAFKGRKFAEINGDSTKKEKVAAQRDWESGKLDLLFVHPKSGGHGLNLQHGGRCLIHLSLPDDPEQYEQFNARIDRLGAEGVGFVYRIMAEETVEDCVLLPRLLHRAKMQELLLQHCKDVQGSDDHEADEREDAGQPPEGGDGKSGDFPFV